MAHYLISMMSQLVVHRVTVQIHTHNNTISYNIIYDYTIIFIQYIFFMVYNIIIPLFSVKMKIKYFKLSSIPCNHAVNKLNLDIRARVDNIDW